METDAPLTGAPSADAPEVPGDVEVIQPGGDGPQQETVMEPAKLLRIASMVRQLLDDTRQATLDEGGRKRLTEIYQRSVNELGESISQDLKDELSELAPPLGGDPSESEIRIAQAQLVGWLEGLFQGIQAALWAQSMQARAQLEELRRRGLPPGFPGVEGEQQPRPPGHYL